MSTTTALINIGAINGHLSAVETAFEQQGEGALIDALGDLHESVGSLGEGPTIQAKLELLLEGGHAIDQQQLDALLTQIRRAVANASASSSNRARKHGDSTRFHVQIRKGAAAYKAREDQLTIAKRAVDHFGGREKNGKPKRRGIFRYDTGMGKSLTYSFILQALKKAYPQVFKDNDTVVIMGSHQKEPALGLAAQTKAVFQNEGVLFLDEGNALQQEDLKDASMVVGSYQQLAQEGMVAHLKAWAGKRRVIFIVDEADMVVFKGKPDSKERDPDAWHPSWIRPFIEFGIFDDRGRYNPETKHYLLGATATLDRPDGIPLSTFWGPGNCFYHVPMTNGISKGLLVCIVGIVAEMDIAPNAIENKGFKDFVDIRDGKLVVDKAKIREAAGSDQSVKTAVRAALDHMMMQIGVGERKRPALRRGIGYTLNKAHLEKHMRWNQELFDLVEVIFNISNGLFSEGHPMRTEAILQNLREMGGVDRFSEELKRFLKWQEWDVVAPLFEKAKHSLASNRKEGVKELFAALYQILNVDLRRIKGRPLVATAAWESMDEDGQGRKVRPDKDSSTAATLANFPNTKWSNRFGSRAQTMRGFNDGAIDMIWSIGMLDRGFNEPMASLAVDNAPSDSRREVVQRVGRISRPPDGRNPLDHSRKPEAIYVTVTQNLTIHQLDLSRQDVARVYGTEIDPELRTIRIHRGYKEPPWKTPDPLQLDLGDRKKVHVVRLGANTAQAVLNFLKEKYGEKLDKQVVAFDAEMSADDFQERFVMANRPYKEKDLRKWLVLWEADEKKTREIMRIYHSDLAEMKTVYGNAWQIVSQGGKAA